MNDVTVLTGAAIPPEIRVLRRPPATLYLRGTLPRGARVGIVGTRHPTADAERYAFELAEHLATVGVAIVSGGAKGIDAAAHRGALAAEGQTVVVAPSSFDRPYPEEHAGLFAQVVEGGGAHLSCYREAEPPRRERFFARNSHLVALCDLLVVVEAGYRSGARNAAKWARELGCPLYVVPWPPWHVGGRGCLSELERGALPLTGPRGLLRHLDRLNRHPVAARAEVAPPTASGLIEVPDQMKKANSADRSKSATTKPRTRQSSGEPPGRRSRPQPSVISEKCAMEPDAERVLEAVRAGCATADHVCLQTALPVGRVQQMILTLRLKGVLSCDPSGAYLSVTARNN